MQDSLHGDDNPYQSPQSLGAEAAQPSLAVDLRNLHAQVKALAACWIILGGLAAGIGFFAPLPRESPIAFFNNAILMAFIGIWGIVLFFLGAFTWAQQRWSMFAGLALTLISGLAGLIVDPVCGIILTLMAVVHAFQVQRVLTWSKRLHAVGISPTTPPDQLALQPQPPPIDASTWDAR